MRALITGAAGMLGRDLVARLRNDMEVLGSDVREADLLGVDYLRGDLADRGFVRRLFDETPPEIVFHLAAMTDVDGCEKDEEMAFRANVEATRHVTDACRANQAHLVFFSTDYVFDGTKKGEYVEEDPPNPLSIYGKTKEAAERHIRQEAHTYTIFRISWLYGCHGRSFPRTILEKAAKGLKSFEVADDQVGRPTYTRDLAQALGDIFMKYDKYKDRLDRQTYHLTNQGVASWADFAEFLLKNAVFNDVAVKRIETPEGHRPAKRPKNSVLSTHKAENLIGVRMRPWQEAAREFLEEIKSMKEQSFPL